MRKNLYWDEEDGHRYLTFNKTKEPATHQKGEPSDASIEQLCHFCDEEAAGENLHVMNGVHRMLAALMMQTYSKDVAHDFIRRLAEHGGLSGLGNERHNKKFWKSLGVPAPPAEWEIK